MNNKIYAICYNSLDVFKDKKSAKEFYLECYRMSEGAEQKRYAEILIELDNGNISKDKISKYCNRINIQVDSVKDKYLNINLDKNLSIEDTIKYYEDYIVPILNVSNKYNIDFDSNIPFEQFGADSDYNMTSFTKYYKDLFANIDLSIDDIKTNSLSDGKYRLIINDKEQIDITAWDNLDNVVDNIERINYLLSLDNKNKYDKNFNDIDNNLKIEETKKMGKGWKWYKYDDGSGYLQSPNGKEYMEYDLATNEYKETSKSRWEFFPLNYYYADGYNKDEFKPFEYMEQEMIEHVLPRENIIKNKKELDI